MIPLGIQANQIISEVIEWSNKSWNKMVLTEVVKPHQTMILVEGHEFYKENTEWAPQVTFNQAIF